MKSEAVMYLSDRRGSTQSSTHQSFHCFNFGSYQESHRNSFKNLTAFNEETLAPAASLNYSVPGGHLIFLLPVAGGIEYKINDEGGHHFLDVGSSILLTVKDASVVTVSNPYPGEQVNFIYGCFSDARDEIRTTTSFDLDTSQNSLVTLFTTTSIRCHIGKFSGRQDVCVELRNDNMFAFVLEGAFELQNRLLQRRDALSMTNISRLEFEALSNQAILLIFEL